MKSKILIVFLIGLLIIILVSYFLVSFDKKQNINQSVSSGISGFVTIGPTCPVQRNKDDVCDFKTTEANIVVKDKNENVIKNTETMTDGRFSVDLSPGNYVVYTNLNGEGLKESNSEYVKVRNGKFSEVTVRIDAE